MQFLAGDQISLKDLDIVDVGCGDGSISFGLANRTGAASVLGVDIEPVDLEFLDELAHQDDIVIQLGNQLKFEVSHDNSIPLGDSEVDLVVAWSVLEHVRDLGAFFREVRRVLKPDAYFFCQVWPLFYSEHGSHLWPWLEPFRHLRVPDRDLRRLVREEAGEIAGAMLDLYDSCSRTTLDDIGRALVDNGFFVSKVELMTNAFHVPPELQSMPLSLLGITGCKLLAVNRLSGSR